MDGRHPGGAVPSGSGLDGYAGEPLACGGEAGRGPYFQFRLVIGGEQQEGRVGVEHVACPFDGALEQSIEVVGGGGADEDLERVRGAMVGRVGDGGARRALEHGALVVAHEETDGGGLALGGADPQM